LLLITGSPGVGKTTVLTKIVNILKERGCLVGGMLSREVREDGRRVGFEILDISSLKRGWLAQVDQSSGPKVGKYRVNLADFETIGVKAISDSIENCDLVAIDEIGPMELFSEKFRDAVNAAIQSQKSVVAVVHWKAQDRLINKVKARKDAEILEVTTENREKLAETTASKLTL